MDGLFQSDQQRKSIEDYFISQGWNPPAVASKDQKVGTMPAVVVESEPEVAYPEVLYRKKADDVLARRNYVISSINKATLTAPEARDLLEKRYKSVLDTDLKPLPDFAETPAGKNVAQFAPFYQRTVEPVVTLRNELEDISKMEDPKEKSRRLRGVVPKLIQSVATNSSDALQPAEFFLGAPEMSNYFDWAKANGGHSLTNLYAYINNPASSEIFESDPDSYLKKAKAIWNSAAKSKNFVISSLEEASSPDFVRQFGIKKMSPLEDAADYNPFASQAPAQKQPQAPQMIKQEPDRASQRVQFVRDSSGRLVPQPSK
jgi:hypothetical protein